MNWWLKQTLGLTIAVVFGVYCCFCQRQRSNTRTEDIERVSLTTQPNHNEKHQNGVILWWTNELHRRSTLRCDQRDTHMLVTSNRAFLTHPHLKAILFYGSDLDTLDLPLPRNPNIPWALLHDESPKNVPFLSQSLGIALFNLTSTFSRHSTFPLSPMFLKSVADLANQRYVVPVAMKNEHQQTIQHLAPIAYVQSICDTMTGRDNYVQELMKYIQVDAYGKCLHNRDMPDKFTGPNYISTFDAPEFYTFLARYKFVIAFENSACDDYVTEKLWRPLTIGVVPIYFGAPNVKQWLPHPKSAILVSDFETPEHLAKFVQYLNDDDEAYAAYSSGVSNTTNAFLLNAFAERNHRSNGAGSIFVDFECSVAMRARLPAVADTEHYKCNESVQRFAVVSTTCGAETTIKPAHEHYEKWLRIWRQGACEAELLDELVRANVSYAKKHFIDTMLSRYKEGRCNL